MGLNKICPLMSRNLNPPDQDFGRHTMSSVNEDGFVLCQQEKCGWWTGLFAREGEKVLGAEYGCAIRKLAEKGPDGFVDV